MPRRGENIYKRKDNRWEGRYIKGYDTAGKAQYGYVYSHSYREVREKLHTARAGLVQPHPSKKKNVSYYCDEWLALSRNRVKESTYLKYHNCLKLHIKPALGDCLPQSLTTMQIEEFSSSLLQKGLSAKTVRDILTILRSVLNHIAQEEPSGQPFLKIVFPREQRQEMRVLSMDEQNRFVHYLLSDMDPVKFGILLALLTGMRIGEICALRWTDISLDEKTIHITSTMQRLQVLEEEKNQKTKIMIGDAKSQSSARTIPLSSLAMELCIKMKPENGRGYILTGSEKNYMEPRLLQYWLKQHTSACGLEGVHFHTLRHTFATRCVEVGFEIKSLSEILGHSSVRVTLDRYVHSSIDLKRSNMEKLSAVGM